MIFVYEQYLKSRRAKVKAWKAAGNRWVSEKNKGGGWYSFNDYESKHPCPVIDWDIVARVGVVVVVILALAFSATMLVVHHKPTHSSKATTSQVHKDPSEYKVGDKVQVVYGDFRDSVGVVIKVGGGSAIIKLTYSTYTNAMADSQQRTGGRDIGTLLSIASLDNLVPYKDVK